MDAAIYRHIKKDSADRYGTTRLDGAHSLDSTRTEHTRRGAVVVYGRTTGRRDYYYYDSETTATTTTSTNGRRTSNESLNYPHTHQSSGFGRNAHVGGGGGDGGNTEEPRETSAATTCVRNYRRRSVDFDPAMSNTVLYVLSCVRFLNENIILFLIPFPIIKYRCSVFGPSRSHSGKPPVDGNEANRNHGHFFSTDSYSRESVRNFVEGSLRKASQSRSPLTSLLTF